LLATLTPVDDAAIQVPAFKSDSSMTIGVRVRMLCGRCGVI